MIWIGYVLLCWLWLQGSADAGYVQECHNGTGAPGTTTTCTFGSSVTTGNTVICAAAGGPDATATWTLSDTASNTYTSSETYYTDTTSNYRLRSSYSQGVTGGFTVVTVTWSTSVTGKDIVCHEVSGVSASPGDGYVGQYQTSVASGTDTVSSTAITTTANGDYIFGASYGSDLSCINQNAGTGYTGVTLTGCVVLSEYQIQTSAGSIAATFSPVCCTQRYLSVIQALKISVRRRGLPLYLD